MLEQNKLHLELGFKFGAELGLGQVRVEFEMVWSNLGQDSFRFDSTGLGLVVRAM